MAMAIDTFCDILVAFIEPEKEFVCTTNKFLMQFEAVTRRVSSDQVITKRTSIELDDSNDPAYMDEALSEALLQLLVPRQERSSLVNKVMLKASEVAQKPSPYAGGKRLRMRVNIDIFVIDDEKLERTI